jgi:hypothetical protein
LTALSEPLPRAASVAALPWVFRARPVDQKVGRYDEAPLNYVDPPDPKDQSMACWAAWDEKHLYVRLIVTDDVHVQDRPADQMWQQDSVQVAFTPQRDHFEAGKASWDFLMGGYRGPEAEFGVSLRGDVTDLHVWKQQPPSPSRPDSRVSKPPSQAPDADARSLLQAKVARHGTRTVYDIAADWRMVATFSPKPERSFGITIVVNDVDKDLRRSAEYGGGVVANKRPTEFAAFRLVDR